MNKKNWLILSCLGALLAAGPFLLKSNAAEPAGGARPWRGQWLERAKEKLGLTDEQVEKIKAELRSEKDTLKGLIARMHEARTQLREAIQAQGATETSVRSASAKVAEVEADLAVERLKLYSRISPLLTSDQIDKLKAFRARIDEAIERAIDRAGQRPTSE